jgi:hypothetical protein
MPIQSTRLHEVLVLAQLTHSALARRMRASHKNVASCSRGSCGVRWASTVHRNMPVHPSWTIPIAVMEAVSHLSARQEQHRNNDLVKIMTGRNTVGTSESRRAHEGTSRRHARLQRRPTALFDTQFPLQLKAREGHLVSHGPFTLVELTSNPGALYLVSIRHREARAHCERRNRRSLALGARKPFHQLRDGAWYLGAAGR